MLIEFTIDLPCTHFNPASITLHFELSIMIGTREISGSAAIRFRNLCMAASELSMPSSILTSSMLAPDSTCGRAPWSAAAYSFASINLRNLAEPVTLVRSPTMTKFCAALVTLSSAMYEGLEAGEGELALRLWHATRRIFGDDFGDGADVVRGRAATAADDVD